jgi:hypothetical protein
MIVLSSYLALALSFSLSAYQPGQWLLTDTLELNPRSSSSEVGFYQDGIIFQGTDKLGICLLPLDGNSLENGQPLFKSGPFPGSPATCSFTSDYTRGYFTGQEERASGRPTEKIYESGISSNSLSAFRQLAFTREPFRFLHPAISSNDSMMVFASDRPPGSGGLDLFLCRKSESGWSIPVSLGKMINSSGHEWYPFLDSRNNLWFSSSGHSGHGGYDIYFCLFNGEDWDAPRNLGTGVNSAGDELGFSIHPDNTTALLSRTSASNERGLALRLTLHQEAPSRDIALVMQQLADPATPLATKPPATASISANPAKAPHVQQVPVPAEDPLKLVFRVQIISSEEPGKTPSVVINGDRMSTFEYYYKGAYRITVGTFETVAEANAFRLKCRDSGFNQAFVAAFRGEKRETDPSVFK